MKSMLFRAWESMVISKICGFSILNLPCQLIIGVILCMRNRCGRMRIINSATGEYLTDVRYYAAVVAFLNASSSYFDCWVTCWLWRINITRSQHWRNLSLAYWAVLLAALNSFVAYLKWTDRWTLISYFNNFWANNFTTTNFICFIFATLNSHDILCIK